MPASPTPRVGPEDPRYATLVRGFNLRWVGTPSFVQVCDSTEDVRAAVQHAVDHDLRVTVRGGGHCYENFVSGNDGGVIIDLTPMHGVYRDEAAGAYVIEGGCTLWNVYWNLYRRYGVALPAGSCYSVGAGGHITGGGYGLLARLHGLTVDHLDAVELVHVDADGKAQIRVVARDSPEEDERGLLWAHQGGGGGNFGVVTRFFFRTLPKAPSEAHLVTLAWDWKRPDGTLLDTDQFGAIMRNYGDFLAANSAVGSPYSGLFGLLHLFQSAKGQITLAAQYVGDEPRRLDDFVAAMIDGDAPAAVAPRGAMGYHGAPPPSITPRCLPWLYATQMLDGSGPNQRGKYKSSYMLEPFPDDQIAALYAGLSNPSHPNPQALVQVDSYGCQVNAVKPGTTAVPQRSSIMKLQFQTYWTDPLEDEPNLKWIRDLYEAMYGPRGPVPDAVMDGCYVNYPDVDLEDWQYLYYKDDYARLMAVKGRWDPLDVFNHEQSIELP
jgi:FAD/FMN-containing dehydrogenase